MHPVLYSGNNVGSFADILHLINDGAEVVPKPVMKKTCTMFFGELSRAWAQEACNVEFLPRLFVLSQKL
jgi:hypothetical protein